MKLHSQQIEMLAYDVVRRLVEAGDARIEAPQEAEAHIARLLTEDLQVEDRLNEEVRDLLARHEPEMRMKGIQYHEMFKIVKQKLARERKLIL